MKLQISAVGLACAIAILGACAPRPAPPPQPVPPPQPAPAPEPPPPPAPAEWTDAPLSPGDWAFSASAGNASASFGAAGVPAFVVRCAGGRILLVRPNTSAPALTIRTTYGQRSLPVSDGNAVLAASDPLLDQMAFSRGRFMIETAGAPPLILPAWPEPARVVEDCRQ